MIARSGAAIAAAALTLALAACGGTSASPTDVPAETTTETTAETPTETPAETEVPAAVEPATGPAIGVAGLRVHAPQGWRKTISVAAGQGAFPLPGALGTNVNLTLFPNGHVFTVEELASMDLELMGAKKERLDDRTIDGVRFYHLRGSLRPGFQLDRYGSIVNDGRVAVAFQLPRRQSRAERDELIESVLASAQVG